MIGTLSDPVDEICLEDKLEIFTITEELVDEIICKSMAPTSMILRRKRKLDEDVETRNSESPAKRRIQITCDNAPKVQNTCDMKAPEVQKKTVKADMVQIGQDYPRSPQQNPPKITLTPKVKENKILSSTVKI